jgi:hypothetical protein
MPAIPAAATFFTVYETAKRSAARGLNCESSAAVPCILAAALAEGFSCFVRVPFEQLKMRMQVGGDGEGKRGMEGGERCGGWEGDEEGEGE